MKKPVKEKIKNDDIEREDERNLAYVDCVENELITYKKNGRYLLVRNQEIIARFYLEKDAIEYAKIHYKDKLYSIFKIWQSNRVSWKWLVSMVHIEK